MNRHRNFLIISILILSLSAFYGPSVIAEPEKHVQHEGQHQRGHGGDSDHKSRFGYEWKETLTDEQREKIDKMHLMLKKSNGITEAQLGLKKEELKALVLLDRPDKKAVSNKVDEIAELKAKLLLNRYEHIIEMREVLTPKQRIHFDMAILRDHHGKHAGKGKHMR